MRMAKRNPVVVGLDIGTYKVGVIVAEVGDDGVEITGIGTQASTGLKKGTVVNIEATVDAIRKAVDEAELMASGRRFPGCARKTSSDYSL